MWQNEKYTQCFGKAALWLRKPGTDHKGLGSFNYRAGIPMGVKEPTKFQTQQVDF